MTEPNRCLERCSVDIEPIRAKSIVHPIQQHSRSCCDPEERIQAIDGLRLQPLRLPRLDAGAMPSNLPSQRVLENAGFTRVGVMRSFLFIADRWEDHVLYELVGPDFVPPI